MSRDQKIGAGILTIPLFFLLFLVVDAAGWLVAFKAFGTVILILLPIILGAGLLLGAIKWP